MMSLDTVLDFCKSLAEPSALYIVFFPGAISMDARSWFVILLSSWLSVACPASVHVALAQDSKATSGSWWNPMTWGGESSDSSLRDSSYFNGEAKKSKGKPSAWGLPKLSWGASDKESTSRTAPPRAPNMFQKMGQSTRQAWSSTTDFFNPFNDAPPAPKNQGYQPQKLAEKPSASGGGMFGWMKPKPPVEKPASVNDWLSQERPRF